MFSFSEIFCFSFISDVTTVLDTPLRGSLREVLGTMKVLERARRVCDMLAPEQRQQHRSRCDALSMSDSQEA